MRPRRDTARCVACENHGGYAQLVFCQWPDHGALSSQGTLDRHSDVARASIFQPIHAIQLSFTVLGWALFGM